MKKIRAKNTLWRQITSKWKWLMELLLEVRRNKLIMVKFKKNKKETEK